ncbi:MAG: hypothetical protein PHE89_02585 [Alphaproteobacteria bacterium]|nr:hypothetical protein [Alphaproteobacteria bacterium]
MKVFIYRPDKATIIRNVDLNLVYDHKGNNYFEAMEKERALQEKKLREKKPDEWRIEC